MGIAIVAGATLAYGVYAGERANSQQIDARKRQRVAQAEALRVQMLERQRAVQGELKAAERASPASTVQQSTDTASASDLTGGVAMDRLRLARRSTLGGGA